MGNKFTVDGHHPLRLERNRIHRNLTEASLGVSFKLLINAFSILGRQPFEKGVKIKKVGARNETGIGDYICCHK